MGRSLGGGHGNPFQHSCLENPMDREAWSIGLVMVNRAAKSQKQLKRLSTHMHTPRVPDLHFDTPTVVSGEGFNFGSHTAVGGSHKSGLNHLERASRV